MHALRHAHEALAPGGRLLLLHPYAPENPVEAAGVVLGSLDAREFAETARAAERGLEQLVAEGLYARECEQRFDVLEHFTDADALLAEIAEWGGTIVPASVADAVRAAAPPFQVRLPLVLHLLRAID